MFVSLCLSSFRWSVSGPHMFVSHCVCRLSAGLFQVCICSSCSHFVCRLSAGLFSQVCTCWSACACRLSASLSPVSDAVWRCIYGLFFFFSTGSPTGPVSLSEARCGCAIVVRFEYSESTELTIPGQGQVKGIGHCARQISRADFGKFPLPPADDNYKVSGKKHQIRCY